MKMIFLLDKKLNSSLKGRDIRNLIGGLLPDGEVKERIMNKDKKENTQSVFIYPMPSSTSFEIINYTDDVEAIAMIEEYLKGAVITINGNNSKISKVRLKDEEGYIFPVKDLMVYKTRTPIIVALGGVEHRILYNKEKNGEVGDWLRQKIQDITKMQMKEFFDYDLEFEDLEIKLLDFRIRSIAPHKEKGDKRYFQGIYCEFISNYKLPTFLGYQTGLGFGEIKTVNMK